MLKKLEKSLAPYTEIVPLFDTCAAAQAINHRKKSIQKYTDECIYIYGECAHEQHVTRTLTLTLTLTHMITAYSVSGNVVRVRTLVCVFLYGFFPVINGLCLYTKLCVVHGFTLRASARDATVSKVHVTFSAHAHST